jgi:hypothetical protein
LLKRGFSNGFVDSTEMSPPRGTDHLQRLAACRSCVRPS